jgi:hypothetical protein
MADKGQSSIPKHQQIDNPPSTPHGEVTLSRQGLASDVQKRDCESDVATGSRYNETCGIHISFLSAPVRGNGFVVACAARGEDLLRECKLEGSTLRQKRIVGQPLSRESHVSA